MRTISSEIKACFEKLRFDNNCRSIVVSGKGKIFTAGLDLTQFSSILMAGDESGEEQDIGRRGFKIKNIIENFQDSLSSIENVIALNIDR